MSARSEGVLVAEKIGDSGIELLRRHFDVDLGVDWSRSSSTEQIGEFDGLLIRSATKLDAELLGKATSLKAVGRAGVGVDNVDVAAATKRGIVVADAPESNVITAAEHTMALLLALARNVPQAHASLTGGAGSARSSAASSCTRRRSGSSGSGGSGSSSRSARRASGCT